MTKTISVTDTLDEYLYSEDQQLWLVCELECLMSNIPLVHHRCQRLPTTAVPMADRPVETWNFQLLR